ncbi:MAG: ABC transporter permease [Gemmatimonadetes bacterium]|nr:ABC transporter permease [Gemmatimonadota bacterium]
MEEWTRPVRFAIRKLGRTPTMTAIALLTLALGIGANVGIFSIVNAVLLRPLPFDEPDRLVGMWHVAPGLGFDQVNSNPAAYFTYREEGTVFEDVALWDNRTASVTGLDQPEQVEVLAVTDGLFPILRVQATLGRIFSREDDLHGSPETVMLSFDYWQTRFGGDPGVLGRSLEVQGRPREVIGVMPPSFWNMRVDPDLYMPLQFEPAEVRFGNFDYQGVGRLLPGVDLAQANAEVARLIPRAVEAFPGIPPEMVREAGFGPDVHPLKEDVVGDVGSVLWVLLGTVGVVFLIACANVANLFLVRAEGRQREVAVRTAMGAGRGAILGGFLSESVLLGFGGGLLGVAIAMGGIRVLRAVGPESLPRIGEIGLDPATLAVALVLSVLAGVAFGLVPATRYGRPELVTSLKEGGRGSSEGPDRNRLRSLLVVGQVAMALVLLIGSGLMIRSFQSLRQVNPGFGAPEEVLTFRVSVPEAQIADPVQVAGFYEQVARRLEEIPGVRSVGASSSVTMDGWDSNDALWIEDFPQPPNQLPPIRRFKWIGEGYFETMQNPLLAGRTLTWADVHDRSPAVVVSRGLALEYWQDPVQALGRRVGIGDIADRVWVEIVGVVGDVRDDGVDQDPVPVVYWPMAVADMWESDVRVPRSMAFAIRSSLPTAGLLPQVREAVWGLNPNLPLAQVNTLAELLDRSMARTSFTLVMLGVAALMALTLGVVGIYGVVSYVVSLRTREIGVRMALGAGRRSVRRMVLRQGLTLTLGGVVVGLVVSAVATRAMAALLYGVSPVDPVTFGGVAAVLAFVAALASWVPAARATRIDPVETLRGD